MSFIKRGKAKIDKVLVVEEDEQVVKTAWADIQKESDKKGTKDNSES